MVEMQAHTNLGICGNGVGGEEKKRRKKKRWDSTHKKYVRLVCHLWCCMSHVTCLTCHVIVMSHVPFVTSLPCYMSHRSCLIVMSHVPCPKITCYTRQQIKCVSAMPSRKRHTYVPIYVYIYLFYPNRYVVKGLPFETEYFKK